MELWVGCSRHHRRRRAEGNYRQLILHGRVAKGFGIVRGSRRNGYLWHLVFANFKVINFSLIEQVNCNLDEMKF